MPSPTLVNDLSGFYWLLADGGRQYLSEDQWKLEVAGIFSKKREERKKPARKEFANLDDVLGEE